MSIMVSCGKKTTLLGSPRHNLSQSQRPRRMLDRDPNSGSKRAEPRRSSWRRERPVSVRPRHCAQPRQRSLERTDSGRSACGASSQWTRRWREMDSNSGSGVSGSVRGSRRAGLRTGRALPDLRRDAALPVRRNTRCCARASSGRMPAAQANIVMNSRRLIRSPRRQPRAV